MSSNSICDNLAKNTEVSSEAYPGITSAACSNYVSNLVADGNRDILYQEQMTEDYINEKGLPLLYYPYLFEIDKSEKITGEHSAATYGPPLNVYMIIDVKDAPSWVSAAGFGNDETLTGWLHITTFENKIKTILGNSDDYRKTYYEKCYNLNYRENFDTVKAIEPKPKDLIQLTTYGCDRPFNRGNRIWEISNVEDEILAEKFNNMMGHYVWKITAKRFRYGFETGTSSGDTYTRNNPFLGAMGEIGNQQVFEEKSVLKMFLRDKRTEELDDVQFIKEEVIGEKTVVEEGEEKVKEIVQETFEKPYEGDNDKNSQSDFDQEVNKKDFYNPVNTNGWF